MRKLMVLFLVVALAVSFAVFGAGWKWGKGGSQQAGWTWDEGVSTYVWINA